MRVNAIWTGQTIYSEPGGYTVSRYNLTGYGITTCVGTGLPELTGVKVVFDGEFKENKRYGTQFVVSGYSIERPTDADGVISYLSCGLIKGIGAVTARRIWDAFGTDSLNVLKEEPSRLVSIKGISPKKLIKIQESFHAAQGALDIYDDIYQQGCKWVTPVLAAKILSRADHDGIRDPLAFIRKNPYWLTQVSGIQFLMADELAKALGHPADSLSRFEAASEYVLSKNEESGDTAMNLQQFGWALLNVMKAPGIDTVKVNAGVNALLAADCPVITYKHMKTQDGDFRYIYRTYTYETEENVADSLIRFSRRPQTPLIDFHATMKSLEASLHLTLSPTQRQAVRMALEEPVSVITGGPGTGKTTILRFLSRAYAAMHPGESVLMLAPTGRAARRMAESTGHPAYTIHKRLHLLDSQAGSDTYTAQDVEYITDGLLIIDESSMLDIFVASHLLDYVTDKTKIVFVGDVDQLPSVGSGAVLRDIITSGLIPVTVLTRIYRQSGGSIVDNAGKINTGNIDLTVDAHFQIHDRVSGTDLEDVMVNAYISEIKKYPDGTGYDKVACLCPVRDYAAGVRSMNLKIQAALNPPKPNKPELKHGGYTYRPGDLVMQLKNEDDVMNGDVGYVIRVQEDALTVAFTGSAETVVLEYEKEELDELTLAYAMTVHKAQGSEYRTVITCLQDMNRNMQKRNLIYTAVTRAKENVLFFGSRNALNRAILTETTNQRRTLLGEYLKAETRRIW